MNLVQIVGDHRGLALILQPDERDVVVHDEPAGARGAVGGARYGPR